MRIAPLSCPAAPLWVVLGLAALLAGCREPGAPSPDAEPGDSTRAVQVGRAAGAAVDSALAAHPAAEVPGTYTLAFCRAPCAPGDTARAHAAGTLTLLPGLPVLDGVYAPYALNGCFRLRAKDNRLGTLAGLPPADRLHWWRRSDGVVMLTLARSPDAAYDVDVAVTPAGLVGAGSVRVFRGQTPPTRDYVAGRRTGPPDSTACAAGVGAP
jgi:hypothetical protein